MLRALRERRRDRERDPARGREDCGRSVSTGRHETLGVTELALLIVTGPARTAGQECGSGLRPAAVCSTDLRCCHRVLFGCRRGPGRRPRGAAVLLDECEPCSVLEDHAAFTGPVWLRLGGGWAGADWRRARHPILFSVRSGCHLNPVRQSLASETLDVGQPGSPPNLASRPRLPREDAGADVERTGLARKPLQETTTKTTHYGRTVKGEGGDPIRP